MHTTLGFQKLFVKCGHVARWSRGDKHSKFSKIETENNQISQNIESPTHFQQLPNETEDVKHSHPKL